jgi:glycosyltransferase involved in cell wall biosynthesis
MKFSVQMCVYNGDDVKYFEEAVQSILQQSLLPDEVVLVVDGPIRQKLDVLVQQYARLPLFKVFRLPVNQGLGYARCFGLEHCRYDYVAIMDADDVSVPDRFFRQMQCFVQDDQLCAVGGNIQEVYPDGTLAGRRLVPELNADIYDYLRRRCPFNHMTVMFCKKSVIAAGGYLDWYYNEDYYLWIRMALQKCKFYNLPAVLVRAHVDAATYQRRGGWRYFCSECALQKFMYRHGIISIYRFGVNVFLRFCLQVLFPNSIRKYIFRKFARD